MFGENARAGDEEKSKKRAAQRAPVVRLFASILRFDLCSRAARGQGITDRGSCGDALKMQDRSDRSEPARSWPSCAQSVCVAAAGK